MFFSLLPILSFKAFRFDEVERGSKNFPVLSSQNFLDIALIKNHPTKNHIDRLRSPY